MTIPVLAKILSKIAIQLAFDEDGRKILIAIIAIPITFIIIITAVFQFIITQPFAALTTYFSGTSLELAQSWNKEHNNIDDFDFAEFEMAAGGVLFIKPTIPSSYVIARYGESQDYFQGVFHTGIDFAANGISGTPVRASMGGKVTASSFGGGISDLYGNLIVIKGKSPNGTLWETRYAHLQDFKVNVGDVITQGDIIGTVGSTGNSTGPHLHFEIIKNGTRVDPMEYIGKKGIGGVVPNTNITASFVEKAVWNYFLNLSRLKSQDSWEQSLFNSYNCNYQ